MTVTFDVAAPVVVVPDTPEELLDLARPDDAVPFKLRLFDAKAKRARWSGERQVAGEAPVGIYSMPRPGVTTRSEWPAQFTGIRALVHEFVLVDPSGRPVPWEGKVEGGPVELLPRDLLILHVVVQVFA